MHCYNINIIMFFCKNSQCYVNFQCYRIVSRIVRSSSCPYKLLVNLNTDFIKSDIIIFIYLYYYIIFITILKNNSLIINHNLVVKKEVKYRPRQNRHMLWCKTHLPPLLPIILPFDFLHYFFVLWMQPYLPHYVCDKTISQNTSQILEILKI